MARWPDSSSSRYALRIVAGLARWPDSSSSRYALRIVAGLARWPDSSSSRYALCIVAGLAFVRQTLRSAVPGVVGLPVGRISADVDPPPGEPGRQPGVLALFADGQ